MQPPPKKASASYAAQLLRYQVFIVLKQTYYRYGVKVSVPYSGPYLPDPVLEDLIIPFGDFVKKYSLEATAYTISNNAQASRTSSRNPLSTS